MRPINLEIEGFTSFRERVAIDFSALDLFAITGPTGAGKTSIIDAMTYALYGCTPRIGERQVAELISQGLTRMNVLFRFSSGKDEYRIARVGKWTGKQIITDIRLERRAGDEWISLADGVQKARPLVEQIVGLDFNGFTKSVVLPQGRFDEFLKGRAEDRRKILSDLLDLEIYKRMMQRANVLHNDHKAQAAAIGDTLQKEYGDATPEHLAKLRNSLQETTPQLEPVELQLKRIAQLLPQAHALRTGRKEFSKAEAELKALRPKCKAAEDSLTRVQNTIDEFNRKLKDVGTQLERNTYDHSEHIRLSALLEKAQRLESVLSQFETLEKVRKKNDAQIVNLDLQSRQIENSVQEAVQACTVARKGYERDRKALAKLQEKYGSPDAVQAAIESQKHLSKLQTARDRLDVELKSKDDEQRKLEQELRVAESDAANARDERDRARLDYEGLVRKHSAELLKPGLQVWEPCPVCEQTVAKLPKTRKHQPLEKAKHRSDHTDKAFSVAEKRVASLQALFRPLDRERASLRNRIAESEQSIREYAERLHVFGDADLAVIKRELEQAQHQVQTSAQLLEELTVKSNAAFDSLKDHRHRRALLQKDVDTNVQELNRLQKESEKLRDELGQFANLERLKAEFAKQEGARSQRERLNQDRDHLNERLFKAKDELTKTIASFEGLEATRKKVAEALQVLQLRIDEHSGALRTEFAQLKRVSGERDEAFQLEQQSSELLAVRDRIQKKIVELEGRTQSLEGKLVRAGEMKQELEHHRSRMAVAKTLHNALQGDEFIAFIQEEAYIRLAADGSVHLKTLSADRYSFTIKKDEFYVVDHWNADEPRPVTTLSGGESFLASLALALALAEGLSGLSSGHTKFALESLFLDEGFGTLDSETLEYVVAGIEGLSSHSRLIGIISHIPELAERMPARIRVEKSIGGSSITLT